MFVPSFPHRLIYLLTTMWQLFLLQEWWVLLFLSLPVDLLMPYKSYSIRSIWLLSDWFSLFFWLVYRWGCWVRSCWKSSLMTRVSSLAAFLSPTGLNNLPPAPALTRLSLMTSAECAHTWEMCRTRWFDKSPGQKWTKIWNLNECHTRKTHFLAGNHKHFGEINRRYLPVMSTDQEPCFWKMSLNIAKMRGTVT